MVLYGRCHLSPVQKGARLQIQARKEVIELRPDRFPAQMSNASTFLFDFLQFGELVIDN